MPTPTDPIPGPDPGACPRCGQWRKAGMVHKCREVESAAQDHGEDCPVCENRRELRRLAEGMEPYKPPSADGRYFGVQDGLPAFGMLLRLQSLRDDGLDTLMATLSGKPSVHGNEFSVPMNREAAAALVVGQEYLFVLSEAR